MVGAVKSGEFDVGKLILKEVILLSLLEYHYSLYAFQL